MGAPALHIVYVYTFFFLSVYMCVCVWHVAASLTARKDIILLLWKTEKKKVLVKNLHTFLYFRMFVS